MSRYPSGGTQARFTYRAHDAPGRRKTPVLAVDHPAVVGSRPIVKTQYVVDAFADPRRPLFKRGGWTSKLGHRVLKGRLRGLPLVHLTLAERTTCPASCQQWRSCYGNARTHATIQRFKPGPDLERRIPLALSRLSQLAPGGYLVRLHTLGDFYSVGYVRLWTRMLERHPALHIYGYSHRQGEPIGDALQTVIDRHWPRFAIRWSDSTDSRRTANVAQSIEAARQMPGTVCPAQTHEHMTCGQCTLCWASEAPIIFLQH